MIFMEFVLFFIIYSVVFVFIAAIPTTIFSLLVFKPYAKSRETYPIREKKLFWKMFWTRLGVLYVLSFFTTFMIFIFDFFVFLIMLLVILPRIKIENFAPNSQTIKVAASTQKEQNVNAEVKTQNIVQEKRVAVLPSSFDMLYRYNEDKMLEVFINKELQKANVNKYSGLYPANALKRKRIMNVIISFLLFIFVTMIFFHFPIYSYVIGAIIILIVYKTSRKFDLTMYLKKEIKARPSEKISNIIMNAKNTLVGDDSKKTFVVGTIIAIVLPLLIFIKPKIIYEKMDNGYGVRFYTFGLTNFTSATIPETYKGEKVVSLRGNTFSNMFFLTKINLPDTITEIRGQAFKNLLFLEEIKLPSKLEYLGGGAFYNCKKLKSVVIPDTVTYLGGESFYGASSLESVKLSKNITEIRGNTFENCKSLKSISIPDKVTRIGGHAFYANSSLSEVIIGENSQLVEIGSSAFRLCDSLYEINIPMGAVVNQRAFKESPTNVHKFPSYINEENRLKHTFGDEGTINIHEVVEFEDFGIQVSLLELEDSRTNKSTDLEFETGNVFGKIKIISNSNEYYYNFNLKDNNYYYAFEDYVIKISSYNQHDDYYDYISITIYDKKEFDPNFKYDFTKYFQVGTVGIMAGSDNVYKSCVLSLDNIEVNGSEIVYTLSFSGYVNKTIKLNNSDNMEFKVDDNLKIKIISVDSDIGINIKSYYN